ncbi:hypothetical protein JNUCC0626_11810 [Lentzea sp. JNUCC 0626]|uniref:hypothetical protein n=1 Tax=Lentzea sp. JNUCC 0626 TaxID=3367513 RepID=UPI00374906EF
MLLRFRSAGRFSRRAGGAGLIGVFGYNVLFFWAVSLAPAIDGSVIVPVLTTIFFLARGKETATPARVFGLVLGVGGSVVFFAGVLAAGFSGGRLAGDLLYVGCAALSVVFLGESLTELQLVGAVVTVAGAALAVSSSRATARR